MRTRIAVGIALVGLLAAVIVLYKRYPTEGAQSEKNAIGTPNPTANPQPNPQPPVAVSAAPRSDSQGPLKPAKLHGWVKVLGPDRDASNILVRAECSTPGEYTVITRRRDANGNEVPVQSRPARLAPGKRRIVDFTFGF